MRMPPILLEDVDALVDGAGENPRRASKIPNYPAAPSSEYAAFSCKMACFGARHGGCSEALSGTNPT